MNDKNKIHKSSEIWQYEGLVEFTPKLVDFFEGERKRVNREIQNDFRHIAFEDIDNDGVQSSIKGKILSTEEQFEINMILEKVYKTLDTLTEVEQRRFKLNRIVGLTIKEIAKLENVTIFAVKKSLRSAKSKIADIRNDINI